MMWKVDGYLAIPHELLHVLAYQLIGKKCRYQPGRHSVFAIETPSFLEKIFILLFPLLITGGLALFLLFLWTAPIFLSAILLIRSFIFRSRLFGTNCCGFYGWRCFYIQARRLMTFGLLYAC